MKNNDRSATYPPSERTPLTPWSSQRVFLWLSLTVLVGLLCFGLPTVAGAVLSAESGALSSYVVRKGDTLSTIGRRHGLSVARLKSLNSLRGDRIKPGQRLYLDLPENVAGSPANQSTDLLRRVIESYLATPYRFGGTSQDGIDCSAFVQQVYRALNVNLPRSAREQYWYGEEVDRLDLHSGDLLFFRTYAQYPSHVGIYLGNGKMVHASVSSHRVVASDIDQPYYRKRFIGAKRFAAIVSTQLDVASLGVDLEVPVEEESAASPDIGPDLATGTAR